METPASSGGRASAACRHVTEGKPSSDSDAYVGYSIHCPTMAVKKRVWTALAANTNTRANVMICTTFSDFLFLKPDKCMNRGAFDTWRWRHDLRDLAICLHKVEATAIEGLPKSMRPTSTRKDCMHYLPPGVGGASAATPRPGGTPTADLSHLVEGASADGSHPGVNLGTLTPHRPRCPPALGLPPRVESLTPLLFGDDDRLVERRKGYMIGLYLGGGSFGKVHMAKSPTGIDVAVKILHKDAWAVSRKR